MQPETIERILEQIRRLPAGDRVRLADEVDRIAWRDRMLSLVDRVGARDSQSPPITDEEIDRIVDEVRTETPLYERYWIRRRQSVP